MTVESRSLDGALAWLREVSMDCGMSAIMWGGYDGTGTSPMATAASALLSEIEALHQRPTREQAVEAAVCWLRCWNSRYHGPHRSPEDCLDAAMREEL